jgi:hypothetical protein
MRWLGSFTTVSHVEGHYCPVGLAIAYRRSSETTHPSEMKCWIRSTGASWSHLMDQISPIQPSLLRKSSARPSNSDLSVITVLSPPSHSRQPAKTPVPNLPGVPDPNCVPAHALRYLNDDVSLVPTAREHTLRPSLRLVFRTIDAQICAAEPVEAPSSEPRAMTEWCPSRRNMPDE